jgi:hypothetical protein
MAEPFLNLRNVGTKFEGIGRCGGAEGGRAKTPFSLRVKKQIPISCVNTKNRPLYCAGLRVSLRPALCHRLTQGPKRRGERNRCRV